MYQKHLEEAAKCIFELKNMKYDDTIFVIYEVGKTTKIVREPCKKDSNMMNL